MRAARRVEIVEQIVAKVNGDIVTVASSIAAARETGGYEIFRHNSESEQNQRSR